ncbi:DEAD/DEAH box helicase [Aureimonas leprariae]|uniref:DEAD/DEAH box helicase n=1 Tax=Plantimonas leprariae TaxID=2615207 RepID=A0A7V7PPH0_9HYPH|nr:DEAD/DEAH box helicase [Aureimonas leprariae]KAB0679880.1 DEAD/DEAH box helicase [Aureimonas leprariae]
MTQVLFKDLGLADLLLAALDRAELVTPTPIQAEAIPPQLKGRDVLGIAQTGTGKTAAFSLPLLDSLLKTGQRAASRRPLALILAPTRELVLQIAETIHKLSDRTKLKHATVFGGVSARPQAEALARGVEIVVATPGRLLDLMEQKALALDAVKYLVLDEADRMLDMGFIRDVTRIVKALPTERQSLLFSATMPQSVASLAAKILREPVRVEVTPEIVTVEKIEQSAWLVPQKAKKHWLIRHLAEPGVDKVVVFTRTKHGANRLAEDLGKANIEALAIHGNKSQGARQKALSAFHSGKMRVLVATDIVARGIHVDDISHVVNFDLPEEPEAYVHRIGRTARAGKSGIAVALVDPTERAKLKAIEKLTGQRFDLKETDIVVPAGSASEERRPPREASGRGPSPARAHPGRQSRGPNPPPRAAAKPAGAAANATGRPGRNRRRRRTGSGAPKAATA